MLVWAPADVLSCSIFFFFTIIKVNILYCLRLSFWIEPLYRFMGTKSTSTLLFIVQSMQHKAPLTRGHENIFIFHALYLLYCTPRETFGAFVLANIFCVSLAFHQPQPWSYDIRLEIIFTEIFLNPCFALKVKCVCS